MKPIINPWIVYLINVVSGLKNIFIAAVVIMGIAGAASMIYFLAIIADIYYDENDEKDRNKILKIKKCFKKSIIGLVIGAVLVVATPSKDTMYIMLTLDNLTTDNIQAIGKTGKDVIDYVSDQIDEIVNGNDDTKENER